MSNTEQPPLYTPLKIDLLGLLPSKGELLALAPYLKDAENLVQLQCSEQDEKVLDGWFEFCDTIGIDGGALISAITLNATLYLVSDDYQLEGDLENSLGEVNLDYQKLIVLEIKD